MVARTNAPSPDHFGMRYVALGKVASDPLRPDLGRQLAPGVAVAWMLSLPISAGAQRLLVVLVQLSLGSTSAKRVSQSDLAAYADRSLSTVQKSLRELEAVGLIERQLVSRGKTTFRFLDGPMVPRYEERQAIRRNNHRARGALSRGVHAASTPRQL